MNAISTAGVSKSKYDPANMTKQQLQAAMYPVGVVPVEDDPSDAAQFLLQSLEIDLDLVRKIYGKEFKKLAAQEDKDFLQSVLNQMHTWQEQSKSLVAQKISQRKEMKGARA